MIKIMNILIISHFFAPYSQVGARRCTALETFLINKGENVFIAKANDKEYGDDVIRRPDTIVNAKRLSIPFHKSFYKRKLVNVLEYWKVVKKCIRDNAIDIVIISGGPFDYFSLIPKVKKEFHNIKCVLDIRDILDVKYYLSNEKLSIRQNIMINLYKLFEKNAVKVSDKCLCVTEEMIDFYKKRYPRYCDKFICIKNGYDDITISENIKQLIVGGEERVNGGGTVVCGIFGKYGSYDAAYNKMLVDCVKHFEQMGIRIRIKQFGEFEEKLKCAFEENGIGQLYEFHPSLGYEKDILELQKCDAAITTNFLSAALGTKIFDYIFINRPILAISPHKNGELCKLARYFENGFACSTYDEMLSAVNQIIHLDKYYLDHDTEKRLMYGRNYQFEKLYEVLESL
uniref:hypothetical protein n=1 Tax=Agathobacter sp. TaxID=2021311 RepID=UPI004057A60D